MSLPLGTYDPTEQIIVFKGQIIDGYAAGTFIKVSRNEDAVTYQPSNSGGGARSRNPNKAGRFEFTLLTSSPANGFLSETAQSDEDNGDGIGECLVKDRSSFNSEARCEAQNAWVVKQADFERAKEVGEVTWIIESDEISIAHAGLTG